jgi:hypothetical protein
MRRRELIGELGGVVVRAAVARAQPRAPSTPMQRVRADEGRHHQMIDWQRFDELAQTAAFWWFVCGMLVCALYLSFAQR